MRNRSVLLLRWGLLGLALAMIAAGLLRQEHLEVLGKAVSMSGMHRHRLRGLSLQRIVQLLSAALFNGYAIGFQKGRIFTGGSKAVCVPVLNCYSCPGALGACPIGALQAALGA